MEAGSSYMCRSCPGGTTSSFTAKTSTVGACSTWESSWVGILTSTWRPWKNLRNSCSTRDSRRRTFSYPYRREAALPNTSVSEPLGGHWTSPESWVPRVQRSICSGSCHPTQAGRPPGVRHEQPLVCTQSPPCCQTRSPDCLDLPSSHDPSLLPPA
uniref:Odorant binding protein 2B n=1 Tax=Macaca mulatta TaxID=9544 RepID=A0A5F8AV73_MACMU